MQDMTQRKQKEEHKGGRDMEEAQKGEMGRRPERTETDISICIIYY